MASTETHAPPARAPVRRKLTVSQAAAQWEETTLAMEGLKGLRDEAARVLLENAEKTGRRTFKDRIAVVQTGGSVVLDQARVCEYLGDRLHEFQKRTRLGLSLKLLK